MGRCIDDDSAKAVRRGIIQIVRNNDNVAVCINKHLEILKNNETKNRISILYFLPLSFINNYAYGICTVIIWILRRSIDERNNCLRNVIQGNIK